MYNDLLERHTVLRVLAWLLAIIAALVAGGMIWSVMLHFGGIILLFFLAWVITFILQPLSTFLERRGMRRLLAVSLIYIALLGASVGSIVLALPTLHGEVTLIAGEVTTTLTPSNLGQLANQAVVYLHHLGLSIKDAQNLVNQVSGRIPQITGNLTNSLVATSTSLLGTAATLLFDTLLVLILSFYMMLDGDRLMESWVRKLPPSWMPDVRLLQRHIDVIFGGFLRAQLIIALVYGVFTWLVLAGLGQPNGLIFALLAAFLMLIPFIGPFLAVVPPVVAVLLQSPPDVLVRNIVIALIVLFVAQQITMQGVAPRVMSAQVGLHPLLLFAALLVGAEEGGVWGAVFAGPVAAVIVAMLDTFFERFQRASGLYPDVGSIQEAAAELEAASALAEAVQLGPPTAEPARPLVVAAQRDGPDQPGETAPPARNGHRTAANGAGAYGTAANGNGAALERAAPDAAPDSAIDDAPDAGREGAHDTERAPDAEAPRDPAVRR